MAPAALLKLPLPCLVNRLNRSANRKRIDLQQRSQRQARHLEAAIRDLKRRQAVSVDRDERFEKDTATVIAQFEGHLANLRYNPLPGVARSAARTATRRVDHHTRVQTLFQKRARAAIEAVSDPNADLPAPEAIAAENGRRPRYWRRKVARLLSRGGVLRDNPAYLPPAKPEAIQPVRISSRHSQAILGYGTYLGK